MIYIYIYIYQYRSSATLPRSTDSSASLTIAWTMWTITKSAESDSRILRASFEILELSSSEESVYYIAHMYRDKYVHYMRV